MAGALLQEDRFDLGLEVLVIERLRPRRRNEQREQADGDDCPAHRFRSDGLRADISST
jgi:hypothetical protein